MSQAAFVSISFLAVLSLFAYGLRYWKKNGGAPGRSPSPQGRVLNVISLGAHQRVVTVEVGSGGSTCQLVLGVTAQSIRTLHVLSASSPTEAAQAGAVGASSFEQALVQVQQGHMHA
jgi:flagellar protein FliO/FliZ